MKRHTKLSIQWFYDLLEKGECDIVDFKEHFDDRDAFAKPHKNFSGSYEELSRDVVAFANKKGGFLIVGIEDKTKDINPDFQYNDKKLYELISGHGSGTVYLIHKRLLRDTAEKIRYVRNKKQEKAIQKEAIMRYLDSMETISNSEVRMLLNLPDSAMSYVSRLLSEMVKDELLIIITPINSSRRKYARKKRKK